jgi:arginine-tRNA-protein transferase
MRLLICTYKYFEVQILTLIPFSDGKLIAIGVLDLLPQCVSAVYFMYHESVHLHNFGKIGALREIAWAKEEGYRWWYAGFYIHSCVKMRYKGDYSPQFILDPQSYSWHPLDDAVKRKLDANKFVSLSQGSDGEEIRKETTGGELMEDFEIDDDESHSKDGDGSDDSNDDSPIPNPDLSLFARSMPGVLTKEQLLKDVDLDRITLRLYGEDVEAYDLVGWESSNIENPHTIKGALADLVAAVGVKLGREMIVSFD